MALCKFTLSKSGVDKMVQYAPGPLPIIDDFIIWLEKEKLILKKR